MVQQSLFVRDIFFKKTFGEEFLIDFCFVDNTLRLCYPA
jgi:hypothetical protein